MKNSHAGLANLTDTNLRAENEEAIRRLIEKFPSPDRPYRRNTGIGGTRGELMYAMSTF